MKVAAIIQARYGSSRLPGKMLLKVLEKTMLQYVIESVQRCQNIDQVILATTKDISDDVLEKEALRCGALVYRGSVNDVLDRYYQAAKKYEVEHIVRITGDCPLVDCNVVDAIIDQYFREDVDYATNCIERTFPDGLDAEIFRFSVLEETWRDAQLQSEHEHATVYIRKHPELFKLSNYSYSRNFSEKRWTLDHDVDFQFIKNVMESVIPQKGYCFMECVLEYLEKHPDVEQINANIPAAEGYAKSLREDKIFVKEDVA